MNFKIARVKANLSQDEAAKAIGVSQSTISQWEDGKTKPRYSLLPKIAEVYGCSIADFFKEE